MKEETTSESKKNNEFSRINRRSFLRSSALIGMSGLAASIPDTGNAATRKVTASGDKFMNFNFRHDGKFKILQLTDTHFIYGDERSTRALKNVCEMLDAEKPDLVIHTGDVIYGKPAEEGLRAILAPMSERNIPFAVTLGNHDEEFGLSREEVFNVIKSLPCNINSTVLGIHGVSNDIITLSSNNESSPKWVFYLFDSNHQSTLEGIESWGWIHFDQIKWYREHSEAFTKQNGGKPVPSLSFFHIPVPEYGHALHIKDNKRILRGNWGEEPGAPIFNSGLFLSMKEMGDMKAIITGHDHNSDFAMKWNDMFMIYGRFSGCDTVYNDLKPNGARVIELTEGEEGFRSWVRLYGGEITQNLKYPDDFRTY